MAMVWAVDEGAPPYPMMIWQCVLLSFLLLTLLIVKRTGIPFAPGMVPQGVIPRNARGPRFRRPIRDGTTFCPRDPVVPGLITGLHHRLALRRPSGTN